MLEEPKTGGPEVAAVERRLAAAFEEQKPQQQRQVGEAAVPTGAVTAEHGHEHTEPVGKHDAQAHHADILFSADKTDWASDNAGWLKAHLASHFAKVAGRVAEQPPQQESDEPQAAAAAEATGSPFELDQDRFDAAVARSKPNSPEPAVAAAGESDSVAERLSAEQQPGGQSGERSPLQARPKRIPFGGGGGGGT